MIRLGLWNILCVLFDEMVDYCYCDWIEDVMEQLRIFYDSRDLGFWIDVRNVKVFVVGGVFEVVGGQIW